MRSAGSRSGRGLRRAGVLVIGLLAAVGCDGGGGEPVVGVNGRGIVKGFVFFDVNGTGALDALDLPQAGVRVFVFPRGSRDTIGRGTSGADGVYRITGVPVGDYIAVVDSATVGDSARVVRVDQGSFTLRVGDSVTVTVGVSYPAVTVAQARVIPGGTRVFVTAVALTAPTSFGDSTVHLADSSGAMRATRVLQGVLLIGDSVRFLGTRGARDGQPVLDNASAFPVGQPGAPVAALVSTATADGADGGRLDAALVRVSDATITDTATIDRQSPLTDDFLVTMDDGSGPVVVVFDGDTPGLAFTGYVPGATVDITGVLVPTGGGSWRIKPRVPLDVGVPR